jgi:4-hydroxy-tetrahydrodipicolinate synthase
MRLLSRSVMDAGAAAVMVAPLPSLRTDDQITSYYRQVAEALGADVPFVVQDYPLLFNVTMSPNVIRRIVMENPSCIALKHEDWPVLDKISTLRKFEAEGSFRHIPILCGNEQQPNYGLAVRKYVFMRRGILASDAQRKPATTLSACARAEVEYLLSRIARADKRAHLGSPS